MLKKKKIVILGSTGSVGQSALEVVKQHQDKLEVLALAANSNVDLLAQQAQEFKARYLSLSDTTKLEGLNAKVANFNQELQLRSGEQGLIELATLEEADIILIAIVGIAGLEPTLAAIEQDKRVALASKEVLVVGGELVMSALKDSQAELIPVDSEHSAIFQCLQLESELESDNLSRQVSSLTLTASGGPFFGWNSAQLENVTLAQALKHPTWDMGQKITIDSATMFNKGLEMIEAKWLFDIDIANINVVVHPQSIIHSMVEYCDGSSLAQLSMPSMTLPILYAFSYPQRWENCQNTPLNLVQLQQLTFEDVDEQTFPAISLARKSIEQGGTLPVVYNAANEVAVELFIQKEIGFNQITALVQQVMNQHQVQPVDSIDSILQADQWAREQSAIEAQLLLTPTD